MCSFWMWVVLCTGLRPAGKLYEELLVDAESEATAHPLMWRLQRLKPAAS
jgi:hypothetical protein